MKPEKQRIVLGAIASGRYFADRRGRIFSALNSRLNKRDKPLCLKQVRRDDGFGMVEVNYKGKATLVLTHQFVWLSFKGKIPKGLELNHKNGRRCDNTVSNLELVTRRQNAAHAVRTGLTSSCEDSYHAVLDNKSVRLIRKLVAKGVKQVEFARWFGVDKTTIRNIVHRKSWKNI